VGHTCTSFWDNVMESVIGSAGLAMVQGQVVVQNGAGSSSSAEWS